MPASDVLGTAAGRDSGVVVLLPVYNGARFLPEQLASLAAQTHAAGHILARDDGSRDESLAVLTRGRERLPQLRVEAGANKGVVAGVFDLLRAAPDAAYYAFCDQDDVWHPDKLARAVAALRPYGDAPALYCTRVRFIDAAGAPRGDSPGGLRPAFANALVENVVRGCTAVLNRAARRVLVERLPDPRRIALHDWWAYLVISAVGTVVFDDEPALDYRLHGGNVVGAAESPAAAVRRRARDLARLVGPRPWSFGGIAAALHDCHGERLPPPAREILAAFLAATRDRRGRLGYALGVATGRPGHVWRQRRVEDLGIAALIAAGIA